MLRVVKNVTWRQRITNEVLYARLPRISTTVRERCLRFSGHCWRSKNEVSDLVLWEPKLGKRSIGGQACVLVDLLEEDPGVLRDCLLAALNDRVGWRKGQGGSAGIDLVIVVVVIVVVVSGIWQGDHWSTGLQVSVMTGLGMRRSDP